PGEPGPGGCRWQGPPPPMSPTPALATVPCAPRDPPVPLPWPGPDGKLNAPKLATISDPFFSDVPRTPLGSPKPPVWTSRAGLLSVAGCELPENAAATTSRLFSTGFTVSAVVNVPVTTFCSSLGFTGTGTLARSSLGCNSTLGGSTLGSGGVITLGLISASTLGEGGVILIVGAGGCSSSGGA